MADGRIVVSSLYTDDTQIDAVAAIYLQHFLIDANAKNRDQFLRDMLTSKYKEWPAATNFVTARSLILLRGDVITCAATIRLHRMSHSKFLEVILFATHKDHVKKGYGGLLSSILLWKARPSPPCTPLPLYQGMFITVRFGFRVRVSNPNPNQ